MRKTGGFKIGKRLVRFSRWFSCKDRNPCSYRRLRRAGSFFRSKTLSKLISWGCRLTNGAKSTCSAQSRSGYIPIRENPTEVPKGHSAVYVGQNNGDFHRVLVPVIYFNHPLFGELLRDAEKEYGFSHPGGITLPCRFSEFERIQTRIAAGTGGRKAVWKRHNRQVAGKKSDDDDNSF